MEGLSNVKIKLTDNTEMKSEISFLGPRLNDILYIRKNIYEFMKETLSKIHGCDVLEVGPRTTEQDIRLSKNAEHYSIYTKGILEGQDNTYKTCDLDSKVEPDFRIDVNLLPETIGTELFDVIICCEVLEHAPMPWKFPETFYKLLKDGGRLFLSVPFYCRQHDPKPDYWRFTEDALKLMFEPYFNIETTKLLWKHDDGQRPVHLTLEGIKK
jgi:hypothetical protein